MAEAPNPSAPGAAPAPAADAGPIATPEFTPAQLQALADNLVTRGKLTREQADAELRADGVTPAVQPTEQQAAFDRQYPRAESVAQYEMPRLDPKLSAKDASTFDRNIRGALLDAGFDRGRGSSLLKAADRAITDFQKMNPVEQQLHNKRERAKLERIWGPETPAKLAKVRGLVDALELRRPGIKKMIEAGAGSDAMVLSLLATQAEIAYERMKVFGFKE